MDNDPPENSRESVVLRAIQSNNRGFVTENKDDLEIATGQWRKDGLQVIEVKIDDETTRDVLMLGVATKIMGPNVKIWDFFDALDEDQIGEKLAFTITLDTSVKDASEELIIVADDFRNMSQHNGVRYIIAADNIDKIPREFNASARKII